MGRETGFLRKDFVAVDRLSESTKSRSPLAPLKKGGTRVESKSPLDKSALKVPLLKGDLGGSRLGYQREIERFLILTYHRRSLPSPYP